jgi:hypothetical protein
MIIDHNVRTNNVLESAEDHLLPRDKREVFLKPFVFLDETIRILHRRADDIDVINLVKTVKNVLTVLNDRRISEEARRQYVFLGTREGFHFRQPFDLVSRLSSARVFLIKSQVLFKDIGQDTVHIHCERFHASVNRMSGGRIGRGHRTVRGVADKGKGKPITDELESNYDWACWTSLNLPFALGSLYRNGKTSTVAETLRHPQNSQGTLCGGVFTCEPTGKHEESLSSQQTKSSSAEEISC